MPIKGYDSRKDRELKEEIADKDRQQREAASKRDFVSSVIGSGTKLLPSVSYKISGGNGPEWYKRYVSPETITKLPTFIRMSTDFSPEVETLGVTSASIVTKQTGAAIPSGSLFNSYNATHSSNYGPARVVVHEFMPYIGKVAKDVSAGSPIDPQSQHSVNAVLLHDISQLGKVNSRAIDPDTSVPGLYLAAGIDIYSFLVELKLVIQLAYKFTAEDTDLGNRLITAKGWNPLFVRANLPALKEVYRIYAKQAVDVVPIPADSSLLARRIWLNSVIIKDAKNDKGVYILFRQYSYGILWPDGSYLNYGLFHRTWAYGKQRPDTIAELQQYFIEAFTNLGANDEFVTFISNMRAANTRFASLPNMDFDYDMMIDANDEVKLQLLNIRTMPSASYPTNTIARSAMMANCAIHIGSAGEIYQARTNPVVEKTITNAENMIDLLRYQVSMLAWKGVPRALNSFTGWDDDKVLVATRLYSEWFSRVDYDGDTSTWYNHFHLKTCGTEFIMKSEIHLFSTQSNQWVTTDLFTDGVNINGYASGTDIVITADTRADYVITKLAQIDGLYPVAIFNAVTVPASSAGNIAVSFNVGNLTQMDDMIALPSMNLQLLHDLSIRSEWYIPFSSGSKKI